MNFDIIILTYNSGKKIKRLLEGVITQSLKPQKIIVIDSSSFDDTVKIAQRYGCDVKIIRKEDFDHGGTRTYGAKLSDAEFLIYLTDDVKLYDNHSFENLISFFKDEKIAAVFGRQIPYEDTNIFGKHLRYFNYPDFDYLRSYQEKSKYGIKTAFLSDSFCAYRKKAIEEVGYFKEKLILGEDTYIGAKLLMAGYKLAYSSKAIVYHSHNYTAFDEFKRYFDIGVFHKKENWILNEFGKAENEGKRYIISGIKFLTDNNSFFLIPFFIFRSFLKYLGYKLGYNYQKLPVFIIKHISMHKSYWT